MWKQLSLTVGVCFGVGLGLAPSLPVAHASKCNIPGMSLELETIEGDADPDPEEAYWSPTASISRPHDPELHVGAHAMKLGRP